MKWVLLGCLQSEWESILNSSRLGGMNSGHLFSSGQFGHSVMSDSLRHHGLQYSGLPWWCYPTISSSIIPFSSCLQPFPASGSFQRSQLFATGGQSIEVSASASVLSMNIQDWFPLGWTGWVSFQSKGLSRVFFDTTVFFNTTIPQSSSTPQFKSINSLVLSFLYSPTLT